MRQTYDDGHRKKPNNKNRESNSKSVFRLLSARKIVGHLKAHANFVFQAVFKNLKNEKRNSATDFRFSRGRTTNDTLMHAFFRYFNSSRQCSASSVSFLSTFTVIVVRLQLNLQYVRIDHR